MSHIYAGQSGGMPENRTGEHAEVILFFLKKEKNHQKKNFFHKAYALLTFLYILLMYDFGQQKAVTPYGCNGFSPGQNTTRRVLDELYN